MVTEGDLREGRVYPPLSKIRQVSLNLAEDIIIFAYSHGLAYRHPRPENIRAHLQEYVFSTTYESFVPPVYPWPEYTTEQPM